MSKRALKNVYAAERNELMTGLVTEAIRKMVEQDSEYEKARRRFMERIKNAPNRGIGEKIPWTRDEIYDRSRDRAE